MPRDSILIAAFNRGCTEGRKHTKYGRTQCPYGPSKQHQRDAWFAGYDWENGL